MLILSRRMLGGFLLALFLSSLGPAFGAEVTRRDGTIVRGEIVQEDESKVIVNVTRAGMSLKVAIPREEITSIDRNASAAPAQANPNHSAPSSAEPAAPPVVRHAGPVYYRIPLRGPVGTTVVASLLEKSLADAALRSPSAVVIEMDSPGGLIQEVDPLIEVIARHKRKLRIVVWVKEAISAAAITALCADEIYMQKGATFGAATAFRVTPLGTPDNITEKMQSVWRARGRSAAELGSHSPLLGEAMIDPSGTLYVAKQQGKPVILARAEPGAEVMKPGGKLLTLTAQEAVKCGLARAIADTPAELGQAMGFAGWKECEGLGVALAEWWEKRVETASRDWKAAMTRVDDAFRQARSADPSTYNDYRANDMESVRKWNERTTRCVAALRIAENNLANMAKLAEEYPHLGANREMIDASRRSLAEIRARIEESKVRVRWR